MRKRKARILAEARRQESSGKRAWGTWPTIVTLGVLLFLGYNAWWVPYRDSMKTDVLPVRQHSAPPAVSLPASANVALTPEERAYLEGLGSITVCPDPDWKPYGHVDAQGNFTGIAADLLHLLEERLDIAFTYVFPEDREAAIALSMAGKAHILPFLNQAPAREQWLVFTEPLFVDPNVFVTREEHPFITNAGLLPDASIVLPPGTSMEEMVRHDFPNLAVFHVPSEMDAFRAVSHRNADMTLRSLAMAAYTIRREGLFNLKIAGWTPDQYANHLRMGVLHNETMLRDILDKGIATITDAERAEITNRHVYTRIEQPVDYALILRFAAILLALFGVSFYWSTRLRQANAALQEIKRSKSVLLANLPGMAYRRRYDRNWTMEFVSEGCRALTGYSSDELLGNRERSFNDLLAPEDRGWIREKWEKARADGEPARLEYRIVTADGSEKWVFEQGVFVRGDDGQGEMIEGVIIDITDRKHAE